MNTSVKIAWTIVAAACLQATAFGQAGPVIGGAGRVVATQPANISRPLTSRPAARPVSVVRPTTQPVATQPSLLRVADNGKFDFGKIWDTDVVKHTFEMTNTGDRTVAIKDVHTSCGCTKSDTFEKQIEPGATWKLPIELTAKGRRGKTSKSITVTTDDPGSPQVVFQLDGEITPRFDIKPGPAVNFGTIQRAAATQKTLSITNQAEELATLKNAKVDVEGLKVDLREVDPGRKYELDVRTVPPIKQTNIRGKITIETGVKEVPELSIYAYASIQPRVSLKPQVLMVPMPLENELRRRLVVKAGDGVTIQIKEAKASNPKIDVKVEPAPAPAREGSEYYVWVTVPPGLAPDPAGEVVTVTTDDPETPTLTAAVRAFAGRVNRNPQAPASQRFLAAPGPMGPGGPPATQPAQTLSTRPTIAPQAVLSPATQPQAP